MKKAVFLLAASVLCGAPSAWAVTIQSNQEQSVQVFSTAAQDGKPASAILRFSGAHSQADFIDPNNTFQPAAAQPKPRGLLRQWIQDAENLAREVTQGPRLKYAGDLNNLVRSYNNWFKDEFSVMTPAGEIKIVPEKGEEFDVVLAPQCFHQDRPAPIDPMAGVTRLNAAEVSKIADRLIMEAACAVTVGIPGVNTVAKVRLQPALGFYVDVKKEGELTQKLFIPFGDLNQSLPLKDAGANMGRGCLMDENDFFKGLKLDWSANAAFGLPAAHLGTNTVDSLNIQSMSTSAENRPLNQVGREVKPLNAGTISLEALLASPNQEFKDLNLD